MRILIYGINYAPELTGIGKYTSEMAEWLAHSGHEVHVITAPMYYPAWRIGVGFSSTRYQFGHLNGVDITRCPLYVPSHPSGARRILHLFSFALSSAPAVLWKAATWRPDLILSIAPSIACAPASWIASRISSAVAWLHLHDFELDAAFGLGMLNSITIRRCAAFFESFFLTRFDQVSTISQQMLNRLAAKGLSDSQIVLFPNWVDTDRIYPAAQCEQLRSRLNIPTNKTIVLYSGNIGEKQGLEILIECAEQLSHCSSIHFIICGDGCSAARMKSLGFGIENIQFIPLQSASELNNLLNLADIHVLPQRKDAADLVMPSKLSNILSCGGAVVAMAARGTQLWETVTKAGGVVCDPGDSSKLATCVLDLAVCPARRRIIGKLARAYAVSHLQKSCILNNFFEKLGKLDRDLTAMSHLVHISDNCTDQH